MTAASSPTQNATEALVHAFDRDLVVYGIDIVLTTYESLRAAAPTETAAETRGIFAVEWQYVVADEATYMKNPASQNAAVVRVLRARARIFLTATPTPNARIGELRALLAGLGCSFQIRGAADEQASDDDQRAVFRHLTIMDAPLPEPEPQAARLYSRVEYANMTEDERQAYVCFAERLKTTTVAAVDEADHDVDDEDVASTPTSGGMIEIQRILQMRKYCISPVLVMRGVERTLALANAARPTPPKMRFIMAALKRLPADKRALVHCEWISGPVPLPHISRSPRSRGIRLSPDARRH